MTRILVFMAALALSTLAQSQGFAGNDTTCYNWQGGNYSAGSFSKCRTDVIVAAAPKAAPLPPPVQPSPVMMPQAAPISCAPPPKPVIKRKPKPKPVQC